MVNVFFITEMFLPRGVPSLRRYRVSSRSLVSVIAVAKVLHKKGEIKLYMATYMLLCLFLKHLMLIFAFEMTDNNDFLTRTRLLVGDDAIADISARRVIIFGVGGVGSWCAESLVRSGITHLTIVDSDEVCVSNINRQLMATT